MRRLSSRVFVCASFSLALAACSGSTEPETAESSAYSQAALSVAAPTGQSSLSGTLIETIGRDNAQKTVREYYLDSGGKWIRLFAQQPITITPRTRVTVTGVSSADGRSLRVSTVQPDVSARVATATTAALNPTAPPGSIALFLIKDPSAAALPYTQQQIRDLLFNASTSTDAYFQEASYGNYSLSGDVFGWHTIDMSSCDNTISWLQTAMDQAAQTGFDSSRYRFAAGIYVRPQGNCFYANADHIGSPNDTGLIQTFVVNSNVFAHEIGHVIGLSHASSLDCRDALLNRVQYSQHCTHQEYNDPFDGMGFDGFYYHFNSKSKAVEGWLPAANEVRVVNAGDYTIVPQEVAANGTQSLIIPVTDWGEVLHVELRKQFGFDNQTRFDNAVLVRHTWDGANPTELIDMTPNGDMNDASLSVGQTFQDPISGVSIRLVSATSSGAVVHVTFGGTSCSDGIRNGTETDVDCGGLCNRCDEGKHCTYTRDCWSDDCDNGVCASAAGGGLSTDFYRGKNFDQYFDSWVSTVVDYDWGDQSPIWDTTDHFSVRWTGQVLPYETGNYGFRVQTDDGVRLWVNNQLLIDRWQDATVEADASIQLTGGQAYQIKMEYFENEGNASARLLWRRPGRSFDLIPENRLRPGGCTLATAANLFGRNNFVSLPSNGCAKITEYPDYWQYTPGDVTLQAGTGTFPVPATWRDECTNQSAQITFRSAWQTVPSGRHTQNCPVLITLRGNGSNMQLSWF